MASRLGVTLSIVIVALPFTVAISVTLGVLAASRGGFIDRFAPGASLFGYVVPNLLLAIVLVVLTINLELLPATGYTPVSEAPARWAATITITITP